MSVTSKKNGVVTGSLTSNRVSDDQDEPIVPTRDSDIEVEDHTARYRLEIKGLTSLLMHGDNIDAGDNLGAWREDPKNKALSVRGDDRSPAWTYQTYLYVNHETGLLAIEAVALMASIRKAASLITLKGNTTFKSISQALIYIDEEYLEFAGPKGPIKFADVEALRSLPYSQHHMHCPKNFGFKLFAKRATVGTARHLRVRPRFDSWSARCTVVVTDTRIITTAVLKQMLELAGTRAGLLAWRPSSPKSPGRFGQFTTKLMLEELAGKPVHARQTA